MKNFNLEEREYHSARQKNILRRMRKFDISSQVHKLEIAIKTYRTKIAELNNMNNNNNIRQVICEDLRYNPLLTFLTDEEKSIKIEADKLKKLRNQQIEHSKVTDLDTEPGPSSEEDKKDPWNDVRYKKVGEPINPLGIGNRAIENDTNDEYEGKMNKELTEYNEEADFTKDKDVESKDVIITDCNEQNDDIDGLNNIMEEFENEMMEHSEQEEEKSVTDLDLPELTNPPEPCDLCDTSPRDHSQEDYQDIDAQVLMQEFENELQSENSSVKFMLFY